MTIRLLCKLASSTAFLLLFPVAAEGPVAAPAQILRNEAAPTRASEAARRPSGSAAPAQMSALPSPPPGASDANTDALDLDGLDVNSAQKLFIKFRGNPEMSGEYRVNADATVSIPVLGRVKVSGVTPAELERQLADKMAELSPREAFVTVEIVEYRPIFVSGLVVRPGLAPWQPGMTVLHAIAMSGGMFHTAEALAKAALGAGDAERARIKKATADLKIAFALLPQLQAERDGKDKVEVPDRLVSLVGRPAAEAAIRAQQSLFDGRRAALQNQITATERVIVLAEDELGNLRAQAGRIQEQLKLRRDNKDKVEDLQHRGFVSVARTLEERIRLSDLEERQANVAVATARVLSTAAQLKRDITKAKLDRQAEVEAEIGKTERDVAQLEIELNSARIALAHATDQVASPEKAEEVIEYSVVRKSANGPLASEAADLSTKLKPGDVVVVSAQNGR